MMMWSMRRRSEEGVGVEDNECIRIIFLYDWRVVDLDEDGFIGYPYMV